MAELNHIARILKLTENKLRIILFYSNLLKSTSTFGHPTTKAFDDGMCERDKHRRVLWSLSHIIKVLNANGYDYSLQKLVEGQ